MSDNIAKSHLESIDNGLLAIEFIQKNKEELQKTYGRSTITGPSARTKISAWEEFLSDQSEKGIGHDGDDGSQPGSKTSSSNGGDRDNGQQDSRSGVPEGVIMGPIDNGNNRARNDQVDLVSGDTRPTRYYTDCFPDDSNGRINTQRNDESPECITESGAHDGLASSVYEHKIVEGLKKNVHERQCSVISDPVTIETFDTILKKDEVSNSKQMKNLDLMEEISKDKRLDLIPQQIKKGTVGNILSRRHQQKLLLKSGATLVAPPLDKNLGLSPVDVEIAQESATNVAMTSSESIGNSKGSQLDEILALLEHIHDKQTKLENKLNSLLTIKEELSNMKKALHNQNMVLSTIEGYISDLMIIVPKYGQDINSPTRETNPDLRMVIGRDHSRGLHDIQKPDTPIYTVDNKTGRLVTNVQINSNDKSLLLPDVDRSTNNASQYIPTDQLISPITLKALVKSKIPDPQLQQEMINLIDEFSTKTSLKEIASIINEAIDENLI
ncbi:phosphoprotein [Boe paramyxovirus]|nr:phosphoprotein [Boe paramyxovirus]